MGPDAPVYLWWSRLAGVEGLSAIAYRPGAPALSLVARGDARALGRAGDRGARGRARGGGRSRGRGPRPPPNERRRVGARGAAGRHVRRPPRGRVRREPDHGGGVPRGGRAAGRSETPGGRPGRARARGRRPRAPPVLPASASRSCSSRPPSPGGATGARRSGWREPRSAAAPCSGSGCWPCDRERRRWRSTRRRTRSCDGPVSRPSCGARTSTASSTAGRGTSSGSRCRSPLVGFTAPNGNAGRILRSWFVLTFVGVAFALVTGWLPADRFVTFGFAIPILAALGLVRVWHRLERRRALAVVVTAALTLAMLAGSAIAWDRQEPFLSEDEVRALTVANEACLRARARDPARVPRQRARRHGELPRDARGQRHPGRRAAGPDPRRRRRRTAARRRVDERRTRRARTPHGPRPRMPPRIARAGAPRCSC